MTEDVNENELIEHIIKFFNRRDDYLDALYELSSKYPDVVHIDIDFYDLSMYEHLEWALDTDPEVFMSAFKKAVKTFNTPVDVELDDVEPRIYNYPEKTEIRKIRNNHIKKFICFEGVVRKASGVEPLITEAAFQCQRCDHVTRIPQTSNKFVEPHECENETCGKKGPFKTLENKSVYVDYQALEIQESPEELKGSQPRSLRCNVYNKLAGTATAGDKVRVMGIVTTRQRTIQGNKTPIYEILIDVNNIEKLEKSFAEVDITEEDEEKIKELSESPRIYDMVKNSISPSIHGYDTIKEALAMQMFSGVRKPLLDGSYTRGDVHIFLLGDPGVAKSKMLTYMSELSPKASYNTGKGASGVGLTASVVQDNISQRWTLEGGSMVMADLGLAVIDEMDKMDNEDRSALHEGMEQQQISIAKAGIIATLKTRCSVLGAANPKYGRIDPYENIYSQINMNPSLLSRFDLIFMLQDIPEENHDRRIAEHIANNHIAGARQQKGKELTAEERADISPEIDGELFKKYVAYAKEFIPEINEEAKQRLIDFYLSIRLKSSDRKTVPITARNIEGLFRLTEASARIRLSEEATVSDAERAIRVVSESMKQVGVDHETGEFDADVIETGTSHTQRDKVRDMLNIIKELDNGNDGAYNEDIYLAAEQKGYDRETVSELLRLMRRQGDVMDWGGDHIKVS